MDMQRRIDATNIQMACMTQLTREILEGKKSPSRNMTNGKPFRTKAQKVKAREAARKCEDGAYRSSAPVSFHPIAKRGQPAA